MNNKNIVKNRLLISIVIMSLVVLIVGICIPNSYVYAIDNEPFYGVQYENAKQNNSSEIINYNSKEVESNMIEGGCPLLVNMDAALQNACAPVAGSNIITYYDRYYENLIENVNPGHIVNSKYKYYPMIVNEQKLQVLIKNLYELMGTNSIKPGTRQSDFKNGLIKYVNSKQRNITFTSLMINDICDFEKIKESINNNKPIILYLYDYHLILQTTIENADKFIVDNKIGNHIMVAYGYKVIKYYDVNGNNFRTEVLLNISSGMDSQLDSLYRVGGFGTLKDVEAVSIE